MLHCFEHLTTYVAYLSFVTLFPRFLFIPQLNERLAIYHSYDKGVS